MSVTELNATPATLAAYNHAYENMAYRQLTGMFDKAMPIETAIDAAILLQNACFERVGGQRLGMNNVTLRRLIFAYFDRHEWCKVIEALNTYLSRFNT